MEETANMTNETAKYLTTDDLDKMVEAENSTWIPPLRASRRKIGSRLEDGHRILGYEVDGKLAGMAAWSYQKINSMSELPKDFSSFSSGKSVLDGSNAAFIYNVGVSREFQNQGIGKRIVKEALMKIREDGITEVYLDGRCPSYNGSKRFPEEDVDPQPEFKKRIDECMRENKTPTVEDVRFDPTLKFYNKIGFVPVHLSPSFLSADVPSGGYRVIMYMKLP